MAILAMTSCDPQDNDDHSFGAMPEESQLAFSATPKSEQPNVITLKNEDREPRTGYRRDRGRYGSRDNRYRSRDRENREERFVREEKPKEDKED